jgi:hypothetical protein
MKSAVVAIAVLLIIASGGFGYYIGASTRIGVPNDSSTASSSSNSVAYPLLILTANWTNQYTSESGYCGLSHLDVANPGTGVVHEGPPEATCDIAFTGSESGTMTLVVENSGANTSIAFEAYSGDPSEVYFLNPQGCPSPGGVGFCGYAGANSTATFSFTWVSNGGSSETKNVALTVLLAELSTG